MVDLTGIELVEVPVLVEEGNAQEMLVTEFELVESAKQVKSVDSVIKNLNCEIIEDRVIVEGKIHKQILYIAEEDLVRYQKEEFEFSTLLSLPGVKPRMDVRINAVIKGDNTELLEEGSLIKQKTLLDIHVLVEKRERLFVELGSKELVVVDRIVGENNNQTIIEGLLELEIPAFKIMDIEVQLEDISIKIFTDKVIVEGNIKEEIYFIDQKRVECYCKKKLSFIQFIDLVGVKPGMNINLDSEIRDIQYRLSGDGVELSQRVMINSIAKATDRIEANLKVDSEGKEVRLSKLINKTEEQILEEFLISLDTPAVKIKNVDIEMADIESELMTDRVILTGRLKQNICFIGENNIERHQQKITSIDLFLDLPGVSPIDTAVDVESEIMFVKSDLASAGERLKEKAVLKFSIKAFQDPPVTEEIAVVSVED
ncbi:DUF3794 domain-containing protein [Acetohalobium arabaticum]|uniref:SipL SPOCS domain-containing protein n=1 Tax=Acetohalobium arabaticum (strain ATCC 49924 / DSM 5501 / Z-7288) TaxID=574087 RepID=D9QST8_ACEAZ|nr:DUF3794 domain-containing protein [Acetohalobium arabaticum]ADL11626.1 conserved hypothetical protein [Acetohalobium arabaticum DSM 5501]